MCRSRSRLSSLTRSLVIPSSFRLMLDSPSSSTSYSLSDRHGLRLVHHSAVDLRTGSDLIRWRREGRPTECLRGGTLINNDDGDIGVGCGSAHDQADPPTPRVSSEDVFRPRRGMVSMDASARSDAFLTTNRRWVQTC